MARGEARVYWSKAFDKAIRERCNPPKGVVFFKVDPAYRKSLWNELTKFQEEQKERIEKTGEPRPIKMILKWDTTHRTLDQNRYLFRILNLKAQIMNDGIDRAIMTAESPEAAKILRESKVTAEELHKQAKINYGQRFKIEVEKNQVKWIREEYTILLQEDIPDTDDTKLVVIKGTRHMNTSEMAAWITRELNELATMEMNSDNQSMAWNLWRDYRMEMMEEGIDLDIDNDAEITQEQYKATHPICEATGEMIYWEELNGKIVSDASLAHIKSRGSDTEMHSNFTSNWLFMKDTAHALWDNGKGRESFLQAYPHLKRKIENALGKEYPVYKPSEKVDDEHIQTVRKIFENPELPEEQKPVIEDVPDYGLDIF